MWYKRHDGPRLAVYKSHPGFEAERIQEIIVLILVMMPSVSVTQAFLLLTFLYLTLTASLPVRDEEELEDFLTEVGQLSTPWFLPGTSAETLLEARLRQLSAGLNRRRQLGDIEFSNRYAEFLRSKARHTTICAFLRRMQGVKKSGVGGDVEKVNQLLKQYMCPSVYNNWPTDL